MASSGADASIKALTKGVVVLAIVLLLFAGVVILIMNFIGDSLASVFSALSSLDVAIVVAMITGTVSVITVVAGSITNNQLSYPQKKEKYLRQCRETPYQKL